MNKSVLAIIAAVLVVTGGGVFAYKNSREDIKETDAMAMEKKSTDEAMMKKTETETITKDESMKKDESEVSSEEVMAKHGSYIPLANYNADNSKYSQEKKVYFFHASWCPYCQAIDKALEADTTLIPAGVTLIKTDFDSETDLRQKYGVTTQYTFVQVDDDGKETAQWSATHVDKAIAGIKL